LKQLFIDAYEECSSSKSCKSLQIGLEKQMALYRETESNLNIMRSKKYISKEQFEQELDILLRQINDLEIHIAEEKNKEKTVLPLRKSENTETAIKKYLDKVIVNGWTVTFIFINGYQTIRRYTNGTVGGQKGNKNTSKNKK
jgi:ribosomal protein S15P/S13E